MPTTFTSASRGRLAHRGLDVGLRGEMEDDVDAAEVDAVADVALDERRRGVDELALPEREVVDDEHLVAARDEGVDEVRADEPGSSGDRRAHRPYRRRAVFISFEGPDGSGKTTQAGLLADWLRERGEEVVSSREPGGTPLGEAIRDVVLHGLEMTAWAEATLFASARAEHVARVIRPALERGAWVVCDRYVDSSIVYQGIARGLGAEEVLELNRIVTGGLMPARTFVLALTAEDARSRQAGYLDRIEREDEGFRAVVAEGYRELGRLYPGRVVILDGSLEPGHDRGAGA